MVLYPKSQHRLYEVYAILLDQGKIRIFIQIHWSLNSSVTDAKSEPREVLLLMLMPQTASILMMILFKEVSFVTS